MPSSLQRILATLANTAEAELQEIRIREMRPLEIVRGSEYRFVTSDGELTAEPEQAYRPTRQDCAGVLELLTQHSLYTFEEELRRGYITIAGGHRVGLSGRTVVEQGRVKYLKEISGFNFRLAREWKSSGARVLPYLIDAGVGRVARTLVVSPPQQGKTTLVRDIARRLSLGTEEGMPALKVGIVDERSEIAACVKGVPRFDVGPRTDVLDACPKAEGMMMMIRSMSPDVLVVDEIGRVEDAAAIHEALHAGISVIATAHGRDVDDIRSRPILRELIGDGVFDRFVVLSRGKSRGAGPDAAVYDTLGQRLDDRLALRGGLL
ncbi:stage III sporulation protein AA [Paenibacillus filicis]|uniref:Stage III sporulation protein AA n=2 Tax=Paenibacillus gyeongsangnamensis TaxID=3388067 RepID=A0ABT4Q7H4_9BACL|nr:stage III sporulation protein AA [Paenibacillus filicis]MCZ8512814.1 stage III sporulation protein AA [Paenibacillus filicis]